ncbi:hypothetical protein GPALN_013073 [Globodera pallida]|nr:hypothetical protein GPALN_013073 [Globodera pallida]
MSTFDAWRMDVQLESVAAWVREHMGWLREYERAKAEAEVVLRNVAATEEEKRVATQWLSTNCWPPNDCFEGYVWDVYGVHQQGQRACQRGSTWRSSYLLNQSDDALHARCKAAAFRGEFTPVTDVFQCDAEADFSPQMRLAAARAHVGDFISESDLAPLTKEEEPSEVEMLRLAEHVRVAGRRSRRMVAALQAQDRKMQALGRKMQRQIGVLQMKKARLLRAARERGRATARGEEVEDKGTAAIADAIGQVQLHEDRAE